MKNKERKKRLFAVNKKKQPRIYAKKIHTEIKKRKDNYLRVICWIVIPTIICALIILDALSIYTFTTERLIVWGVGILILLVPFFSEITVKDVSVKRNETEGCT